MHCLCIFEVHFKYIVNVFEIQLECGQNNAE